MTAMKVQHRVHTLADGRANVQTEVEGEVVTATVPCLEVELISDGDRHGNQTLRFTGSQMAEAKELFKPDAKITVTYAATEEEAPKKKAK